MEANSKNTCSHASLLLLVPHSVLLNHLEPQSRKTKLSLPIMPIGIVIYAFVRQPLLKQLYTCIFVYHCIVMDFLKLVDNLGPLFSSPSY